LYHFLSKLLKNNLKITKRSY